MGGCYGGYRVYEAVAGVDDGDGNDPVQRVCVWGGILRHFANMRSLFEADDLTIVNLEGPLTTVEKPKKHGYVFKADPACVQILTGSGVELCNLANNHSMDFGAAGLKQTAEVLSGNGIGYCGFTEAWSAEMKGVKVTALGFTKWDHTVEQVTQAVSTARQDCDLLIVNMHWGWERQNQQCHARPWTPGRTW